MRPRRLNTEGDLAHPSTRRTRITRAALVLLAGLIASSAGLLAEAAGPPYAGRPLAEALQDLQARGLELFFTSTMVRPEMRVTAEPKASAPREVLRELLAPHGLAAEAGPGGRLVVVAAEPERTVLRGLVRDRRSGRPLAGVRILLPGSASEALTTAGGTFLVPEVAAGSHALEAHLPGFVVERLADVAVRPREVAEILIELEPAPLPLDEIVVTPSRVSLLSDEPVATVALDRDDILALPHLGDDVFRAFTLLPGVTGEEASARFNVRGGRTDEVLVLLDRLELFEPYHLKDYSSALSIIAPRALREVHLITGGFPAEYGDRMSGVLDMSTRPALQRRTHLGLGLLGAEFSSSGTLGNQRGHGFVSLRRGNLDLALRLLDIKEEPRYWDGFGKVQLNLWPGQRLGVHLLHSDDELDFFNVDPDTVEDYLTGYGNSYAWLTHQAILGSRLFVDSAASLGRIDRDRRGSDANTEPEEEGEGFAIVDRRELDVAGLKQDWSFQPGERQYLKWGFEVRRMATDYDYFNLRELDDPLAGLGSAPRTGTTVFRQSLRGEHYGAYVSDRLRPARALTLELGLRHDRQTLTDEGHLSPRVNVAYTPEGGASALRLAWGYFYQSQRPYELQVEDGVTELATAERTEHRVAGFEHAFAGVGRSGLLLRVEAYQRKITNPRPRWENVYEPVSKFPEIEADRILFAPDSAEAYGLEVFLRGAAGERLEWWAGYAYARVLDSIDGRDVPRRIDQPHAFSFDLNYRAGKHWSVNLAWRLHTGWPTTAITGRLEQGDDGELEAVPVFGPLNGDRLPAYHRLDLRASREWHRGRGVLGFFLEIQNVYDRENVAGFDVDFDFIVGPDGEIDVIALEEPWGGILPSFGVTWEF